MKKKKIFKGRKTNMRYKNTINTPYPAICVDDSAQSGSNGLIDYKISKSEEKEIQEIQNNIIRFLKYIINLPETDFTFDSSEFSIIYHKPDYYIYYNISHNRIDILFEAQTLQGRQHLNLPDNDSYFKNYILSDIISRSDKYNIELYDLCLEKYKHIVMLEHRKIFKTIFSDSGLGRIDKLKKINNSIDE